MNNQTDFEVTLRQIMCILLGIETLCICFFLLVMSDDELTVMQLKYHEITLLHTIKVPIVCSCLLTAFTALSVKSKAVYLIYEGLHVVIGLLVFLDFAYSVDTVLFGLPILIVLSSRLIIYILAMEQHKKKHSSQSRD